MATKSKKNQDIAEAVAVSAVASSELGLTPEEVLEIVKSVGVNDAFESEAEVEEEVDTTTSEAPAPDVSEAELENAVERVVDELENDVEETEAEAEAEAEAEVEAEADEGPEQAPEEETAEDGYVPTYIKVRDKETKKVLIIDITEHKDYKEKFLRITGEAFAD